MAESETTEKAKTDRTLAEGEVEATQRGLSIATFLTSVCIIAAIVFFALSNTVAGLAFLGPPILILIERFIPSRHNSTSTNSPSHDTPPTPDAGSTEVDQ